MAKDLNSNVNKLRNCWKTNGGRVLSYNCQQNKFQTQQDVFNNIGLSAYFASISRAVKFSKDNISTKTRKKLKLPEIEPNYTCKLCNDTGLVDGRYCKCLTKEINEILIAESGFGKLESFEEANFEIHSKPEFVKKLYKLMKDWCHSDFNKNLVFLSGQTGVGKTHLARCMAKELIDLNKVVLLTTSFAMNQDFLKSYASKDLDEKEYIMNKYLNAEILFIDDLGTELRQDGITNNYLYLVLNERQERGKATVITSNMTLEDVRDYYDERISSRIINKAISILYYINGSDLRLKK